MSSMGVTTTKPPAGSGAVLLMRPDNNSDARSDAVTQFEVPSSSSNHTEFCTQSGILSTAVTTEAASSDTAVDSALLSALRDPRERVPLLKLEQMLVELVQDPSLQYWDMGGPNHLTVVRRYDYQEGGELFSNTSRPPTSFQRCCLHRLADRFGIKRESTSYAPGYIRLYKTTDTKVPSQLLIDLNPTSSVHRQPGAAEGEATEAVAAGAASKQTTLSSSKSSNSNNKKKKKKKILIKRNSSSSLGNNRDGGESSTDGIGGRGRAGGAIEDKEKAYAEARARIFGTEQQQDTGSSEVGTHEPMDSSMQAVPFVTPAESSINYTYATHTNLPMDSTSTSKATWRNRKEEVNDPDFRRVPVVPVSYQPAAVYGYGYGMAAAAYTPNVSPLPATSSSAAPFVPTGFTGVSSAIYEPARQQASNIDNQDEFPSLGR